MSNSYYDQADLWNKPPQQFQQRLRSDALRLIPKDVQTLLDVGCGSGYITNSLPQNIKVTGTDSSLTALQHVERQRLLSSITQLPFSNKQFDLVMATDVLEHLSEADYQKALLEIQRVADRYVLISVPFMENLASGHTQCPSCHLVYHINYHQRAFGTVELMRLLSEPWIPMYFVFSGQSLLRTELYYRSIRSRLQAHIEWEMAICPRCGTKSLPKDVDRLQENTIWLLAQYTPKALASLHPDRTECLVLFRRDSSVENDTQSEGYQWLMSERAETDIIPVKVQEDGEFSVVKLPPSQANTSDVPIWIILKKGALSFCYSDPQHAGKHGLVIPLWFSFPNLEGLSPASAPLWTGEKGNEILLTAVANMAEEIVSENLPILLTVKRVIRVLWHTTGRKIGQIINWTKNSKKRVERV